MDRVLENWPRRLKDNMAVAGSLSLWTKVMVVWVRLMENWLPTWAWLKRDS